MRGILPKAFLVLALLLATCKRRQIDPASLPHVDRVYPVVVVDPPLSSVEHLQECYQRALDRDPNAQGTIRAHVDASNPRGPQASPRVESGAVDIELRDCVAHALEEAAPATSGDVRVDLRPETRHEPAPPGQGAADVAVRRYLADVPLTVLATHVVGPFEDAFGTGGRRTRVVHVVADIRFDRDGVHDCEKKAPQCGQSLVYLGPYEGDEIRHLEPSRAAHHKGDVGPYEGALNFGLEPGAPTWELWGPYEQAANGFVGDVPTKP